MRRLEIEFGRDLAFLVELCRLKRILRRLIVGAGVLLVGVEKQIVKPAGKIVVMRHVAARAVRELRGVKRRTAWRKIAIHSKWPPPNPVPMLRASKSRKSAIVPPSNEMRPSI